MIRPEFIFDVGSPNAYLAHRVLPAIEARTGASFRYVPCLLGGIFKETGNQSPMLAYADIKNKLDYELLEIRRFVERHALHGFTFNPHFPINTLAIMRAAAGLELDAPDRLSGFVEAAFEAMWENEVNLGDPETALEVFRAAGFDADAVFARAQTPDVKQRLLENTLSAVERGAFGAPTFFVADQMFFGKERLSQVEDEIQAQAA